MNNDRAFNRVVACVAPLVLTVMLYGFWAFDYPFGPNPSNRHVILTIFVVAIFLRLELVARIDNLPKVKERALTHMIERDQGWVRLYGVGLLWKRRTIPKLFSERHGYVRFIRIPGTSWRVRLLTDWRIPMKAAPPLHQRPTHCYKGRCRGCGAVQASVYDMSDDTVFTSKMVADMIRSGLIVAHEVFPGASMSECTCPKPEQQEQLL